MPIIEIPYIIDESIQDFRFHQHKQVEAAAALLPKFLTRSDLTTISKHVKSFIEEIFSHQNLDTRLLEPLFFQLAIINTKLKAVEQQSDFYECLPYPGYLAGKSYFWRQEDVWIDIQLIREVFDEHPEIKADSTLLLLKDFIDSTSQKVVSYDKIHRLLVDRDDFKAFLNRISTAKHIVHSPPSANRVEADCLLKGSDHGCCGNYSGCCYYFRLECYIHDKMCIDCNPRWFCLRGCKPG
jgi:hypothetical protein